MPRNSDPGPVSADAAAVAIRRALQIRHETMKLRALTVERRIERDHARALQETRKRS
jgi:hypothetical protein